MLRSLDLREGRTESTSGNIKPMKEENIDLEYPSSHPDNIKSAYYRLGPNGIQRQEIPPLPYATLAQQIMEIPPQESKRCGEGECKEQRKCTKLPSIGGEQHIKSYIKEQSTLRKNRGSIKTKSSGSLIHTRKAPSPFSLGSKRDGSPCLSTQMGTLTGERGGHYESPPKVQYNLLTMLKHQYVSQLDRELQRKARILANPWAPPTNLSEEGLDHTKGDVHFDKYGVPIYIPYINSSFTNNDDYETPPHNIIFDDHSSLSTPIPLDIDRSPKAYEGSGRPKYKTKKHLSNNNLAKDKITLGSQLIAEMNQLAYNIRSNTAANNNFSSMNNNMKKKTQNNFGNSSQIPYRKKGKKDKLGNKRKLIITNSHSSDQAGIALGTQHILCTESQLLRTNPNMDLGTYPHMTETSTPLPKQKKKKGAEMSSLPSRSVHGGITSTMVPLYANNRGSNTPQTPQPPIIKEKRAWGGKEREEIISPFVKKKCSSNKKTKQKQRNPSVKMGVEREVIGGGMLCPPKKGRKEGSEGRSTPDEQGRGHRPQVVHNHNQQICPPTQSLTQPRLPVVGKGSRYPGTGGATLDLAKYNSVNIITKGNVVNNSGRPPMKTNVSLDLTPSRPNKSKSKGNPEEESKGESVSEARVSISPHKFIPVELGRKEGTKAGMNPNVNGMNVNVNVKTYSDKSEEIYKSWLSPPHPSTPIYYRGTTRFTFRPRDYMIGAPIIVLHFEGVIGHYINPSFWSAEPFSLYFRGETFPAVRELQKSFILVLATFIPKKRFKPVRQIFEDKKIYFDAIYIHRHPRKPSYSQIARDFRLDTSALLLQKLLVVGGIELSSSEIHSRDNLNCIWEQSTYKTLPPPNYCPSVPFIESKSDLKEIPLTILVPDIKCGIRMQSISLLAIARTIISLGIRSLSLSPRFMPSVGWRNMGNKQRIRGDIGGKTEEGNIGFNNNNNNTFEREVTSTSTSEARCSLMESMKCNNTESPDIRKRHSEILTTTITPKPSVAKVLSGFNKMYPGKKGEKALRGINWESSFHNSLPTKEFSLRYLYTDKLQALYTWNEGLESKLWNKLVALKEKVKKKNLEVSRKNKEKKAPSELPNYHIYKNLRVSNEPTFAQIQQVNKAFMAKFEDLSPTNLVRGGGMIVPNTPITGITGNTSMDRRPANHSPGRRGATPDSTLSPHQLTITAFHDLRENACQFKGLDADGEHKLFHKIIILNNYYQSQCMSEIVGVEDKTISNSFLHSFFPNFFNKRKCTS